MRNRMRHPKVKNNIDDADASSVVKNTRQWKDLSDYNVDRFGGHYQLLPHVMQNLKIVPKVQLPRGLIIMCQTNEQIDERMRESCLEQETQSIVGKTRNACAGCISRSLNNPGQNCDSCSEYWPCGIYIWILVNKPFKNHLKNYIVNVSRKGTM
jgi:hypothetical protein